MQNKSRCYVLSFISSNRDKKFKIQRGVELALDKKVVQFFSLSKLYSENI
jgi:hypothetical protein